METLTENIEIMRLRNVFKGDQERSIRAQQELAARRPKMQLENSTKYHPTSNGIVENAVQRVIGPTRVLKGALETNIKEETRPNTLVMTLMVSHAETIINIISVDQDGKTPTEKVKCTRANREIAEFGQRVLFQLVVKYNKTSKLDVRWQWGVLLIEPEMEFDMTLEDSEDDPSALDAEPLLPPPVPPPSD